MTRLTVTYGRSFLAAARAAYPLARSLTYSGPNYEEFMTGPILAARIQFERDWDTLLPEAGDAVRKVFLAPSREFGPIIVYGYLTAPDQVEIVSFEEDTEFWAMIQGDPDG